ncbi:MAG: hypothetical protein Roseis3KO_26250 [Roseivirga sp.]
MSFSEYLYRPQHKNRDELISDFVVRNSIYDRILHSIVSEEVTEPSQHILVEGKRGMGKTTLMLRLTYELQNQPEFQKRFIPCKFNEEEYGIANLEILWERLAEHLEEDSRFKNIMDLFEEERGEEKLIAEINNALEKEAVIAVLFVDNFFQILEKFSDREQQRLREVLIQSSRLKIIAGSARFMEKSVGHYSAPFFEFFKREKLNKLNKRETKKLLIHLAKKHKAQNVIDTIKNEPQRIHNIRILCGGVPRTLITFFEVLMDDVGGTSIEDLRLVMDRTNELYIHRMNSLSKKEQPIIHAMALHWEAIGTGELADKLGEKSGAVSAVLSKLVKQQVIEKVKTDTKNHLWRIEERFFNIWYLLTQAPRKYQRRVKWLSSFIEALYCEDDFDQRLTKHLAYLKSDEVNADHALMLSNALIGVSFITTQKRDEVVHALRELSENDDLSREFGIPLDNAELLQKMHEFVIQGKTKQARDLILDYPAIGRMIFESLLEVYECIGFDKNVTVLELGVKSNSILQIAGVISLNTQGKNDVSTGEFSNFEEDILIYQHSEDFIYAVQLCLLNREFNLVFVSKVVLLILEMEEVRERLFRELLLINKFRSEVVQIILECVFEIDAFSVLKEVLFRREDLLVNEYTLSNISFLGVRGVVSGLIMNDRKEEAIRLARLALAHTGLNQHLIESLFRIFLVIDQQAFVFTEFANDSVRKKNPSFYYYLIKNRYIKEEVGIIPPEMMEPLGEMEKQVEGLRKVFSEHMD